jgi:hypothetical protein
MSLARDAERGWAGLSSWLADGVGDGEVLRRF